MTALVISNVVLWLLVIALALAVLALTRQLGVLHERITPVGALMLAKGLKVGEAAPRMEVADLDGAAGGRAAVRLRQRLLRPDGARGHGLGLPRVRFRR